MSTTFAALKGRMGSTTYFLMFMRAIELVRYVHVPSEEEWNELDVNKRYQRELDLDRVEKKIVPYLLRDKDRFMPSILVANKDLKESKFLPMKKLGNDTVNDILGDQIEQVGFYTLDGKESLLVLDGQHRVSALEVAVHGNSSTGSQYNESIAADLISVLMIKHEIKKSRRLFTVINSNSKSTTAAQTLVTNDDDIVADISRKIAKKINWRLVGQTTGQLSKMQEQFIALPTIAHGTEVILKYTAPFTRKIRERPVLEENKKELYEKKAFEHWDFLLDNIEIWKKALEDKTKDGDELRQQLRNDYLCLRPITMQAIIEAYIMSTNSVNPLDKNIAIQRINAIPWNTSAKLWDRTLVLGNKIAKGRALVTDIIRYIINDFECDERNGYDKLLTKYRAAFPDGEKPDGLEEIRNRYDESKLKFSSD